MSELEAAVAVEAISMEVDNDEEMGSGTWTHAANALSEILAATAGRCDRSSMPIHAAHRAATTAAENLEPGAACGGKGEHYD